MTYLLGKRVNATATLSNVVNAKLAFVVVPKREEIIKKSGKI